MMGFFEVGNQDNRMNVARTLYLAAQNQLTKKVINKELKSGLASKYYITGADGVVALNEDEIDTQNVSIALGDQFPDEEIGNESLIKYISKPAGVIPSGADTELRTFYNMLDEIIMDKSILEGAILMEYNIETGVILAIFYGNSGQENFEYGAVNESENILGGRGVVNGYSFASERRQGYYGIESTGEAPEASFNDVINIYDGYDKPLPDGKINVLYVEALIAQPFEEKYTLELISSTGDAINSTEIDTTITIGEWFDPYDVYVDTSSVNIDQYGVDIGGYYTRFIWVLDYVEGDLIADGQKYSLFNNIGSIEPQNVKAKVTRSDRSEISLTSANTHFARILNNGGYEIKSARHLNNVRYKPDGKFRQTEDIDLSYSFGEITNFSPIDNFTGEYTAIRNQTSQYRISNLAIDALTTEYGGSDVGLFSRVTYGVSGKEPRIYGIALHNSNIRAKNGLNVGSIVGTLDGGVVSQSYNYGNIDVEGVETGQTHVGGLIGNLEDGTLELSFNAGFYDANANSSTGIGSVSSENGYVGGLVGRNAGELKNSYNNARVNIENVVVDNYLSHTPTYNNINSTAILGGLAGLNSGSINNSYATNHVAIYTEYSSKSGGIAGENTGDISNSVYISNECTDRYFVNKNYLMNYQLSALFNSGFTYDETDNTYSAYPYPSIKNNRPFDNTYGWEDIYSKDSITGDFELFYYEQYEDLSFGYSAGGVSPLSTSKTVINDGYLLEFDYTTGVTIEIGSQVYSLESINEGDNWVFGGALGMVHKPIQYATVDDGEGSETKKYRLFFSNELLEEISDGSTIDLRVLELNSDTIIRQYYFNPMFADTINEPDGGTIKVRSPRHLDNIDKKESADYRQELDLNFEQYNKELDVMPVSTDAFNTGITPDGNRIYFGNNAVVHVNFSGTYTGDYYTINNVNAEYGLFFSIDTSAIVEKIIVQTSEFSNGDVNYGVGAISATNSGLIKLSAVINSEIEGVSETTGGITGINTGAIEDVFFLSTNETYNPPVNSGGGITGANDGEILTAMYIAPAPIEDNGDEIILYPISHEDTDTGVENSFYLLGHRHSLDEGNYWESESYNLPSSTGEETVIRVSGGGRGLITKLIDLEWIRYTFDINMDNWYQPTGGYPYPIIDTMNTPERWPEADSPVRPDQEDNSSWAEYIPISNVGRAPEFVSGDFGADLIRDIPGYTMPPGNQPDNIYIPPHGGLGTQWLIAAMELFNGWYTRPVPAKYNLFDTSDPDYYVPASPEDNNFFPGFTRSNVPRWKLIELQEVNGKDDFMRTDYNGRNRPRNSVDIRTAEYRYAELNAQSQGTLYQVLPSTPNVTFYYSFYHATNNYGSSIGNATADRLHFYLSPVSENEPYVVSNVAHATLRDNNLIRNLIRPCQSPRSAPTGTVTNSLSNIGLSANNILNPAAWNTVTYGANNQPDNPAGNISGGSYNLSFHNGKSYTQPNGNKVVQNIPSTGVYYLYDVWVGDTTTQAGNGGTRNGIGITFWSTRLLTTGTISDARIPIGGVSNAQFNGAYAWLNDARNNVIGYWDVSFGWKRYYGEYSVPDSQTLTEFAFQSRSGASRAEYGNYLDGVSFKTPAFLTIDKYIKNQNEDIVTYVKPNDVLDVELQVKNHGEMAVNNVVVSDKLDPFTSYIEYYGGLTLPVTKTTVNGNRVTFNANIVYANDILSVNMGNQTLGYNEELVVTFPLRVRRTLDDLPDTTETLLYYFKNQATVRYAEDFLRYSSIIKQNASGPDPVQVFIDPVKLSKTVTNLDRGIPIDGPFEVTLRIEDTTGEDSKIETNGIINDLIPKGFALISDITTRDDRNLNWRTVGYTARSNADGTTRLTIGQVKLGGSNDTREVEYRYTLEYNGDAYGVADTQITEDYKYIYNDEHGANLSVLLEFPKTVVGITTRTIGDTFDLSAPGTQVLEITKNDGLDKLLSDSGYSVITNIVFTDSLGNPLVAPAINIVDGNQQIDNADYTAMIVRGTWGLDFTPKKNGNYQLYYKAVTTATKPGSQSFNLNSGVTNIVINVTGQSA
jgi:hypothetical protein